jgi:hypothetical protein
MNGCIYFLYTPLITRNYSAIAISTLHNSLLHTHTSSLLVTDLKHRHCNSLTELHTSNITHKIFSSQPHSCNKLLTTLHCTTFSALLHDGFVSLTHRFSAATTRKRPLLSSINLRYRPQIENTSHVIPTQRVHWSADCCLAMSYNIRPIVACSYRGVFIKALPSNALTCHNSLCIFRCSISVVVMLLMFFDVLVILHCITIFTLNVSP